MKRRAFRINAKDNVATALSEIPAGEEAELIGEAAGEAIRAQERIPIGHKLALRDIPAGEEIRKYGIVIGRATVDIEKGSWVHLHVMKSLYDERSEHLDAVTGTPKDIKYE